MTSGAGGREWKKRPSRIFIASSLQLGKAKKAQEWDLPTVPGAVEAVSGHQFRLILQLLGALLQKAWAEEPAGPSSCPLPGNLHLVGLDGRRVNVGQL